MLKVLFVAAEGPFAKTGGLGDVIGSLPKELKQQGVDARVILLNYKDIPEKYKNKMVFKTNASARLASEILWNFRVCL